jgi:hypothetical protein
MLDICEREISGSPVPVQINNCIFGYSFSIESNGFGSFAKTRAFTARTTPL